VGKPQANETVPKDRWVFYKVKRQSYKGVRMRSLNVRLLAIIVGVGVVLAISIFALNRFQVYRQANFRYKTALKTKDSDDIEQRIEAVKNLQRYLSLRPDDNGVRAELGMLMADIAKKGGARYRNFYGSAFFTFEHVLREDQTRSDARRELVEVAMATGRFADAQDHIEVLLRDFPDDADVLMWMGQCQANSGKDEMAIESFKKAIANSPQQVETYARLASLLRKDIKLRGDRDLNPTVEETVDVPTEAQAASESSDADKTPDDKTPADKPSAEKKEAAVQTVTVEDENHPDTWMNRLVKANPDSLRALLIRSQYLQRTHKPDEAQRDAVDAVKHMPVAMKAAGRSLRETAEALKELAKSLPSAPDSAKQAIGGLESTSAQMEAASENAAVLAEGKECPAVEKAVAKSLNETLDALKAVSKSLSDIAAEKERDEDDEDVVTLTTAVAKAKDHAEDEFGSICESLQGALLLLAECEADKKEEDNAMCFALRAQKLFPKSASIYMVLSQLEIIKDNGEAARRWVEHGLDATGDAPGLLWKKANFLIDDLGQAGQSEDQKELALDRLASVTEKLRSSASRYRIPAYITFLSAREAYVQKRWAKASKLLESIHDDLVQIDPRLAVKSDQMAAVCYRQLGRPELARDIDPRSRRTPGVVASRFGGIAKLLAQGNVDAAIIEFDKLKETASLPDDAWVILAQNNLGVNRSREKSKQDWDTFNKVLLQAKQHCPEDIRLVVIAADALMVQEKSDEAQAMLAEACKKNPKELVYWQSLIRVAQQKEDWKLAEQSLDEAQKQLGDSVDLRIIRAIFFINRDKDDNDKASAELKKLSEGTDQFAVNEKVRLWSVLATCAKQAGDNKFAQRLFRNAVDSDPTNLKLRVALFEIASLMKDDEAMAEAVGDIHDIENEGPLWHFYEAVRLATLTNEENEEKRLESALGHLAQSKILRPNWERVLMLIGRIQFRQGSKKAAIESLSDAVGKGSRDPRGIGALVNLLYEQGRNEEAQRYIRLLEDQDAQISTYTRRLQAQDMFMRGDHEKGLEHFREIAENSDNFRDYLQLGQILSVFYQRAKLAKQTDQATSLYEEAEKSLRKAAQLAPDEEAPWLTLVQFYSRSGNAAEALQIISDARKTVSKQRLPLVLARCFQGLGRRLEAEQQYLTAIANSDGKDHAAKYLVDFYLRSKKIDEAEKLLTKIINAKQKASENDVAWARRRMARLLYSKSGLPNRRDAIALVDENLEKDPTSTIDIREKAKLLATFSNTKDRKEAIELLNHLLSLPNPDPEDRYLMANVLLAENDWPGVTHQMRQLLARKDVKPAWLRFYVNALLDRNELGDVYAYLKRLERIAPNDNAVARFNAILLARRGQYNQVVSALDKYVDTPAKTGGAMPTAKDIKNQKTVRLVTAATVLENIIVTLPATESGNDPKKIAAAKLLTDHAEKYWREIAKLHPEGTLRLVRFLSKHGKRDEALTIAETAWNKGNPANIATTVVSLIFTGEATPKQIKRVERILSDATITFGETNSLTLAMAELRSIQRRYEDAESLYRKVLDKDPRNVVALNNLAVFLALRNIKQDEALEKINQAIITAGPKPTLLDSRASVHISKGDWQKALEDLDVAISGKTTSTRFFHQAQALVMGGQKDEAKKAFKKAHDLGLKVSNLQPLERPSYRQLHEALK
jgi:tetratricopeptide (TPR) repeat protein